MSLLEYCFHYLMCGSRKRSSFAVWTEAWAQVALAAPLLVAVAAVEVVVAQTQVDPSVVPADSSWLCLDRAEGNLVEPLALARLPGLLHNRYCNEAPTAVVSDGAVAVVASVVNVAPVNWKNSMLALHHIHRTPLQSVWGPELMQTSHQVD